MPSALVATTALSAAGEDPPALVGDGWDAASVAVPLADFFGRVAARSTAANGG